MINLDDRFVTELMPEIGALNAGVLIAICKHIDKKKRCFPRRKTLMSFTKLTRHKLDKAILELQEAKVLKVEKRFGEKGNLLANLYTVKTSFVSIFVAVEDIEPIEERVGENLTKGYVENQPTPYVGNQHRVGENSTKGMLKINQQINKVLPNEVLPIKKGEENAPPKNQNFEIFSLKSSDECTPPIAAHPPRNYLEVEASLKKYFEENADQKTALIQKVFFRGDFNTEIEKFCEYYSDEYFLKKKSDFELIPKLTRWLRNGDRFKTEKSDTGKTRNNENLINADQLRRIDAMLESEGY